MDKRNTTKPETDPFANAVLYRLRRDSLMIISNLNRGRKVPNEEVKMQLLFVQSQLCRAALADPCFSTSTKSALLKFHSEEIIGGLADRRGKRRRGMPVIFNQHHNL
jgi:hypothetical protein